MNRRYDLLIFDWDGTLSDSAAQIVAGMQAAIGSLQLPPRADHDIAQLIGLGFAEGMERLYPEIDTDELVRLLMNHRARHPGAGDSEAPLFPGALEALERLAADGYTLAVATGKSRRGLERSLRHHARLRRLFSATRTADFTASKPDPLMLSELLMELEVPAGRALMVGDTDYDAQMARAIGMPMLGVTCGVHGPQRLLDSGALALIESVAALPSWLGHPGAAAAG